jgi:AbrB family transcriptional regulator (stage V sporulation protein T)
MKATGIVRRIDDLGRVVIPKEIRRTLRIREGDSLEIFTDRQGEIILKKYSPIGEMSRFAKDYADSLAATLGCTICITDHDQIIAAAGYGKKELQDKYVSKRLESTIAEREQVIAYAGEKKFVPITDEMQEAFYGEIINPVICEGDVLGAVILLDKQEKKKLGETEQRVVTCASNFLGRQMEQ